MKSENQTQLLSKITDLSEDQKLELFNVEELENRLEMVAASEALVDATANGVCWIG